MRAIPILLGGLLMAGCIHRHERVHYSHPGVQPVTAAEAIEMTRAGYADSSIIKKIEDNGVLARPDADALVRMKEAGVSDLVSSAMLEAPVTQYRPPVEHRTVVERDYTPLFVGAALIGGSIYASHRYHRHSHRHYGHRHYYRRCR